MRHLTLLICILALFYSCCSKEKTAEKLRITGTVALSIDTIREPIKSDSVIAAENVGIDTTVLSDKSLLYYQVNNDSLWLTLEKKKKIILFSSSAIMGEYNYRLGYQFSKEFKEYLLFRYGCPANGPCNFALIEKQTGEVVKSFPELIYSHHPLEIFDYLIYFSEDRTSLVFDNINTGHKFTFKHKVEDFIEAINPEYDFVKIEQKSDRFILTYEAVENHQRVEKKLVVPYKKP